MGPNGRSYVGLYHAGLVNGNLLPLPNYDKEAAKAYAEVAKRPAVTKINAKYDPWPAVAAAWQSTLTLYPSIIRLLSGATEILRMKMIAPCQLPQLSNLTLYVEKLEFAKANGADFAINYNEEYLVKRVEEITGGHGLNVVYDSSGIPPPVSPPKLVAKNIGLIGPGESGLTRYIGTPSEYKKWCGILFDLITTGKVNIRIHGTYPLSEIQRVHRDLEGRKTTGKLLVKP
ncbi:MAG: hypothetical protein Q9167_007751 [Letrouitia subvulpina]